MVTGPLRTLSADLADALRRGTATAIAERGVEGVRMADIARHAGVARATLYYHFPTRRDLLRFVHDRTVERAVARLGGETSGDAGARLVAMLRVFARFVGDDPAMTELFVAHATEIADTEGVRIDPRLLEPIAATIEEGRRQGTILPGPPARVLASALVAAVVFGTIEAGGVEPGIAGLAEGLRAGSAGGLVAERAGSTRRR